jgi:hypothetical protein
MSEKKTIRKNTSLMERWRVREFEAWFADMAQQGWLVTKVAPGRATFDSGEPQKLQYRIYDCLEGEKNDIVRFCVKRGWKLVYASEPTRLVSRIWLLFSAPPGASYPKREPQEIKATSSQIRLAAFAKAFLLLFDIVLMKENTARADLNAISPSYDVLWQLCLGGLAAFLVLQLINILWGLYQWHKPQPKKPVPANWKLRKYCGILIRIVMVVVASPWMVMLALLIVKYWGGVDVLL